MTNKEVLDRMYSGEVFEDDENSILYKIENDMFFGKEKESDWRISFISLVDLKNLKPHEPKQELPTWWKHEYYLRCRTNYYGHHGVIIQQTWDDFKEDDDERILIKSTSCQTNTIEEAVKILENIKGEN